MSLRLFSALLPAFLLAACAAGPDRLDRDLKPAANPSAVIAAELALARLAREKGQWTALRENAADDAVMFVPQPVAAKDWLKKQDDPPQAIRWQPHQIWSSCDGSLAVTKGGWQQPDGRIGYFTTVWQRNRNGSYEWVLNQRDTLDAPLTAPDMIPASVAECAPRPPAATLPPPPAGTDRRAGSSQDRTLQWTVDIAPGYGRRFTVRRWTGTEYETVLQSDFTAP